MESFIGNVKLHFSLSAVNKPNPSSLLVYNKIFLSEQKVNGKTIDSHMKLLISRVSRGLSNSEEQKKAVTEQ